jgi:HEAT repeat protein
MSDERKTDPLDENLARLLPPVVERQTADPAFRARLGELLRESAATHFPPVRPRRVRRWLPSAAAFAAAAAATWLLVPRRPELPAPVVGEAAELRAEDGRRGAVTLAAPGAPALARLELRDGATATYWPAPPTLRLHQGFARIATTAPLRVRAGEAELALAAATDVSLELVRFEKGEPSMRRLWIVPTSAIGGAGLTLAVLVATGRVALPAGLSSRPDVPPGSVAVLHPRESAPAGPRRADELERKVAALKQENARLAGALAQRKGVTKDNILERIATLKRSPMPGMLNPGALTDLETDLKGLGDEGVKTMIELLKSKDAKERFLAAKILEDLASPAAIPALKDVALNDSDRLASSMASHALALMDDVATVPSLRAIVDANKTWESKVNALWGLCKHGDERAIAEALAIMKNEKEPDQLRASLGGNLMLLSDPALMPIVDETLRQFASVPQFGTLAVNYYKSVGTPEGRARLQAMAADAKLPEALRQAAQKALAEP